mmetsp:Transcript_56830/g.130506  ORF Transcript_56830/g.130506 Transcript_56830/m.130506 type:complete len:349 (-) Transcript_56830:198-1244(-)
MAAGKTTRQSLIIQYVQCSIYNLSPQTDENESGPFARIDSIRCSSVGWVSNARSARAHHDPDLISSVARPGLLKYECMNALPRAPSLSRVPPLRLLTRASILRNALTIVASPYSLAPIRSAPYSACRLDEALRASPPTFATTPAHMSPSPMITLLPSLSFFFLDLPDLRKMRPASYSPPRPATTAARCMFLRTSRAAMCPISCAMTAFSSFVYSARRRPLVTATVMSFLENPAANAFGSSVGISYTNEGGGMLASRATSCTRPERRWSAGSPPINWATRRPPPSSANSTKRRPVGRRTEAAITLPTEAPARLENSRVAPEDTPASAMYGLISLAAFLMAMGERQEGVF